MAEAGADELLEAGALFPLGPGADAVGGDEVVELAHGIGQAEARPNGVQDACKHPARSMQQAGWDKAGVCDLA